VTWEPRAATSSLATAWCRRRLRWTTWPSGAARARRQRCLPPYLLLILLLLLSLLLLLVATLGAP
jgi:hypothetical protein